MWLAPPCAVYQRRKYFRGLLRYTSQDRSPGSTCPATDENEFDQAVEQRGLFAADLPLEFRLFTRAEGAEGHCEGMAPIIFWTAAFDWLDHLLPEPIVLRNPCRPVQRRAVSVNPDTASHGEQTPLIRIELVEADETDVVALAGLQLTVEADREGAVRPVPILRSHPPGHVAADCSLAKHGAAERRQGVPHRAPFAACLDEVRVA